VALVSPGKQIRSGDGVIPDPAKITKKCLQKKAQSGKFAGLRVSEASEEYGTYEYFRSRTARRVSDVQTTEGGKVLPEKGKLTVEEKAKPVRKRLVINMTKWNLNCEYPRQAMMWEG
jgi:hypothetical protein